MTDCVKTCLLERKGLERFEKDWKGLKRIGKVRKLLEWFGNDRKGLERIEKDLI